MPPAVSEIALGPNQLYIDIENPGKIADDDDGKCLMKLLLVTHYAIDT